MIVITAPTSSIGRQVLASVIAAAEQVRVIARDVSRLPRNLPSHVELIEGSHGDARVVDRALEEADALFWLCPPNPRAVSLEAAFLDFTRPVCEAIRKHGVKRVVGISALGRGLPMAAHAGHVTASLAMDDLLSNCGAGYRALTMPSFMDNLLRQVASIRDQGVFVAPLSGDLKTPTCATRDIAATATRLLLDTSWSETGSVPVLGPEDLSFNEIAQIMSEVLGRPVHFKQISPEAFTTRLLQNGMSRAMAQGMLDMMMAKNQGLDNGERRTPEATTPTSFRQWCAEVLKPAVGS